MKNAETNTLPEKTAEPDADSGLLFLRVLAAGTVIAVILLALLAFYFLRVYEKKLDIEASAVRKDHNPLLTDENSRNEEYGTPDIPGVRVYDAVRDADILELNGHKYSEEFEKLVLSVEKDKTLTGNELSLFRKKNDFAGRRMELLKQLEKAGSRSERERIMKKLSDPEKQK